MSIRPVLFLCLCLFSAHSLAANVFINNGLAINGYDSVAYHAENKAVQGDPRYSHVWRDANWIFVSAENRDLFAKDPEQYAPQYGGFCAYAASKGSLNIPTDPQAWTVYNGKLYLNYSKQVREVWLKDKDSNIKKADYHWNN